MKGSICLFLNSKARTFAVKVIQLFMSNPKITYLPVESHSANINIELKKPKSIKLLQFVFAIAQKLAPDWAAKQALSMFVIPRVRAKHSIEDDLLKSMIRHDFQFMKKKIRIYEWKGGAKKAVLLHGWESRATALRVVVPELLSNGYSVYGIDAPAHGESEGRNTNVVDYASVINEAAGKFGPFDLAVTHSFGGLAISFALVENKGFYVPKVAMFAQPATTKFALQGLYRLLHLEHRLQLKVEEKILESTGFSVEQLSVSHLSTQFKNVNGLLFHDEKDNLVPLHTAVDVVNQWKISHLYVTHGLGHFRLIKSNVVQKTFFDWLVKSDKTD